MSGYCKDCKFWRTSEKAFSNKTVSECDRLNWADRYETIGDDEAAIYADATDESGLEAGLKTGPMFGCIKFVQSQPRPTHEDDGDDLDEED